MIKRIFAAAGLACGVIILFLGISLFSSSNTLEAPEAVGFGADFYTYVYQGVRVAAVNTGRLVTLNAHGFGAVLIAIGLTDICFFGCKLFDGLIRKPRRHSTDSGLPPQETAAPDSSVQTDSGQASETPNLSPSTSIENETAQETDVEELTGADLGDTLNVVNTTQASTSSYHAWRTPDMAPTDDPGAERKESSGEKISND